jgi:hypothetical protein
MKVCAVDDAVCSDGLNFAAHDSYTQDVNLVNQGVDYAATRLGAEAGWPPPSPVSPAPDEWAAPTPVPHA